MRLSWYLHIIYKYFVLFNVKNREDIQISLLYVRSFARAVFDIDHSFMAEKGIKRPWASKFNAKRFIKRWNFSKI